MAPASCVPEKTGLPPSASQGDAPEALDHLGTHGWTFLGPSGSCWSGVPTWAPDVCRVALPVSSQAGITPFLLAPVASGVCPSAWALSCMAGAVPALPSLCWGLGTQLCFPALDLMRFGLAPSLGLSVYAYVCGSAAIPCESPPFPAPLHFLISCQFAEGGLCPSFLRAGECLGLWDGPWSPAWPGCSWVFSCWLQLWDPEISPVFQASFPSLHGALGTSASS